MLAAYYVEDEQIQFQTTAENLPHHGTGAVGLALDPDSETLFVTYEDSGRIELVDARAMVYMSRGLTVPATNLAGIVFDQSKQRLCVVKRGTSELYVYVWDAETKTLTLENGTYRTLEHLEYPSPGAYGLALDETNQHLYVTDSTNIVRYYDANDPNFGYKGSIEITVDGTPRGAVGIAIGPVSRVMYTGAFTGTSGEHPYLVRTDINDINNPISSEKGGEAAVIGLTLAEETGFLYITTWNDHIEDYNTATWPSDACYVETANILSTADIIQAGDVTYKMRVLGLEKEHDMTGCASVGQEITYTISYAANGYEANNVTIVDTLPAGVDFNSASDGNIYDAEAGTVTWHIGDLGPLDSGFVTLTVNVTELADPVWPLTNRCEMESDRYYALPVMVDANVCCWSPDIIYVDDDAEGADCGISWDNAYRELSSALKRARQCGGEEVWVAEGTYHPAPAEETFELVEGVGLYGGFAGDETSRQQRDWAANVTVLSGDTDNDGTPDVSYVVTASDINEAIVDGFTIKYGRLAVIHCDGSTLTARNDQLAGSSSSIECADSDVNVIWCEIYDSSYCGIMCGSGTYLVVRNSHIHDNGRIGIYWSLPGRGMVVENTVIQGHEYEGVYLYRTDSAPVFRNATIIGNDWYGISGGESALNISNCIIWDNGLGSFDPFGSYNVSYSCVDGDWEGTGNIDKDPCFLDANDYHLDVNSPCEDAGDPSYNPEPQETDIDGQPRLMGDCDEVVDMGADEIYFPACWNCVTQCHADADCDGDVDTEDWPAFRDAFSTNYWDDWNDGAGPYNPCADYDRDGDVDTVDWPEFRDNFGKNPLDNNCECGCGSTPDCWPPQDGRGGKGGGQTSLEPSDADMLLEDMILWIMKHDLPGWEEFIESLKGKL